MNALSLASAAAWIAVLTLLVMPCWRILRRKPRYLDAIWAVTLLGVVNRLVFVLRLSPTIAQISAIILAALLALVIRSYQKVDA